MPETGPRSAALVPHPPAVEAVAGSQAGEAGGKAGLEDPHGGLEKFAKLDDAGGIDGGPPTLGVVVVELARGVREAAVGRANDGGFAGVEVALGLTPGPAESRLLAARATFRGSLLRVIAGGFIEEQEGFISACMISKVSVQTLIRICNGHVRSPGTLPGTMSTMDRTTGGRGRGGTHDLACYNHTAIDLESLQSRDATCRLFAGRGRDGGGRGDAIIVWVAMLQQNDSPGYLAINKQSHTISRAGGESRGETVLVRTIHNF